MLTDEEFRKGKLKSDHDEIGTWRRDLLIRWHQLDHQLAQASWKCTYLNVSHDFREVFEVMRKELEKLMESALEIALEEELIMTQKIIEMRRKS